jgi:hypothetical protein
MYITILDTLYLVLIVFTSIIWTLTIVALIRVIKILGPIMEIANFYNKIKQVLASYKHIPEIFKEKVKEVLWNKNSKKKKEH